MSGVTLGRKERGTLDGWVKWEGRGGGRRQKRSKARNNREWGGWRQWPSHISNQHARSSFHSENFKGGGGCCSTDASGQLFHSPSCSSAASRKHAQTQTVPSSLSYASGPVQTNHPCWMVARRRKEGTALVLCWRRRRCTSASLHGHWRAWRRLGRGGWCAKTYSSGLTSSSRRRPEPEPPDADGWPLARLRLCGAGAAALRGSPPRLPTLPLAILAERGAPEPALSSCPDRLRSRSAERSPFPLRSAAAWRSSLWQGTNTKMVSAPVSR
mmetsp:Transcript_100351/g.287105  ORF Transcript_100351/g.287105 Transcript_100351/m.287105 type:complete len:270 (+) Transcript_100351:269-1078(+)